MRHSNICSEVIAPNTCNKCQRDIISKVALKKHMTKCQGKKQSEACKNGDSCRWFKANRCLFVHPTKRHQANTNQNQQPIIDWRQRQQRPRHQPNNDWTTVRARERHPLWTCRFCEANIFSREAGRNHLCEMHPNKSVNKQLSDRKRSQNQKPLKWCQFQDRCFKGQSCSFKHMNRDFLQKSLEQNQY